MPCWTVQKATLDLANPNEELLRAALTALGFNVYDKGNSRYGAYRMAADRFTDGVSVTLSADGKVSVHLSPAAAATTTLDALSREVKRAYAAQVVQAAARRFGWTLKQPGPQKYQAQRRY